MNPFLSFLLVNKISNISLVYVDELRWKGVKPDCQPEAISEILTIVNLRHVTSRIRICTEPVPYNF